MIYDFKNIDKKWQNNIYEDYSDEYEYYNPYYEKENTSEEYSIKVAKEIFNSLSEGAIFDLALAIDMNEDIEKFDKEH